MAQTARNSKATPGPGCQPAAQQGPRPTARQAAKQRQANRGGGHQGEAQGRAQHPAGQFGLQWRQAACQASSLGRADLQGHRHQHQHGQQAEPGASSKFPAAAAHASVVSLNRLGMPQRWPQGPQQGFERQQSPAASSQERSQSS